jgi:hypothetical protein
MYSTLLGKNGGGRPSPSARYEAPSMHEGYLTYNFKNTVMDAGQYPISSATYLVPRPLAQRRPGTGMLCYALDLCPALLVIE